MRTVFTYYLFIVRSKEQLEYIENRHYFICNNLVNNIRYSSKSVYCDNIKSGDDCHALVILQVTTVDSRLCSHFNVQFQSKVLSTKVVMLHVVNGDSKVLTIKLALQMHGLETQYVWGYLYNLINFDRSLFYITLVTIQITAIWCYWR